MIYIILAILRRVRVFASYLFSEGIFFIEKNDLDSAVSRGVDSFLNPGEG